MGDAEQFVGLVCGLGAGLVLGIVVSAKTVVYLFRRLDIVVGPRREPVEKMAGGTKKGAVISTAKETTRRRTEK